MSKETNYDEIEKEKKINNIFTELPWHLKVQEMENEKKNRISLQSSSDEK